MTKRRTPFSDAAGRKQAEAYWQRHQTLVSRAGSIVNYMRGAVPRWQRQAEPGTMVAILVPMGVREQTQTERGQEPPAPPADDPLLRV